MLSILRVDIQEAAGSIQLCVGQISGTEAAIHAIRDSFHSAQCEAVLLIDANNAFNSLNREVALRNIQILCPPFATYLINMYRAATELFVQDTIISSREGTTQGDPLAMPMYALGILPLIQRSTGDVLQVWYAGDASATGTIHNLRECHYHWTLLWILCQCHKTWLVVKDAHLASATSAILGTNVNTTSEGRPHLGAPLGTETYVAQCIQKKVAKWCLQLQTLCSIGITQPHAIFAAVTHSVVHLRWPGRSRVRAAV